MDAGSRAAKRRRKKRERAVEPLGKPLDRAVAPEKHARDEEPRAVKPARPAAAAPPPTKKPLSLIHISEPTRPY